MTEYPPLVLQLQMDAVDPSVPVSNLLQKAKLVSTKLDQKETASWIESELNGYRNIKPLDLPIYRQSSGRLHFNNPYHGLCPIIFQDSNFADACERVFFFDSLSTIENLIKQSERGGHITNGVSDVVRNIVYKQMDIYFDLFLKIDQSQLVSIVNSVRNLVLGWSAELEKAGVLGENFRFSLRDKEASKMVTQNIFANNVGVVGNIQDNASVSNLQSNTGFNIDDLKKFIDSASEAVNHLPEGTAGNAKKALQNLREEILGKRPEGSRIRNLLGSLKSTCEGAAGNVVAAGILALLKPFIG
jgi:hypothetical protein